MRTRPRLRPHRRYATIAARLWIRAGIPTACASPNRPILLPATRCNGYYPVQKTPRLVAGMPIQLDVLKCQLKPIDPADYRQPLSEQLLARLRKVFPAGVCDFSRPGVGFERLAGTWLNYAAPGAPVSLRAIGGPRWASPRQFPPPVG